jgi:hypothetical protein
MPADRSRSRQAPRIIDLDFERKGCNGADARRRRQTPADCIMPNHLRSIIKQLQRMQVGRRCERIDPNHLALDLEDLDSDIGHIRENRPTIVPDEPEPPSRRKPLPEHQPRKDILLDVEDKQGCQAAAPKRLIAGGLATLALLAEMLVSKYCDHTPLYRQSQIFAHRNAMVLSYTDVLLPNGGTQWPSSALMPRRKSICQPRLKKQLRVAVQSRSLRSAASAGRYREARPWSQVKTILLGQTMIKACW